MVRTPRRDQPGSPKSDEIPFLGRVRQPNFGSWASTAANYFFQVCFYFFFLGFGVFGIETGQVSIALSKTWPWKEFKTVSLWHCNDICNRYCVTWLDTKTSLLIVGVTTGVILGVNWTTSIPKFILAWQRDNGTLTRNVNFGSFGVIPTEWNGLETSFGVKAGIITCIKWRKMIKKVKHYDFIHKYSVII